ncbi:MAG: NUDIX hydrolase [Proteobacteria bacterium]|nr:NUDIX hydrolase [Pseudomonadota bacterium]
MHRQPLRQLLDRYEKHFPGEPAVTQVRELLASRPDCFSRTCWPGHVTASAWIVSPDYRSVLLTHHAKLDRWLQLGGHADGDPDVANVALREAREESGMSAFGFVSPPGGDEEPLPLDVDVHTIPQRGSEPRHEHHDVRFLLVARPDQRLERSHESKDLRWFPRSELTSWIDEESLLRMHRKASPWLEALS